MRTDKEQLDLINGNYDTEIAKRKRRGRILTVVAATVLAVSMIVSSVLVLPGLFKSSDPTTPENTLATDPATGLPAKETPAGVESTPAPTSGTTAVIVPGGSEYYITDKGKADKLDPSGRTPDYSGLPFEPEEDAEYGIVPAVPDADSKKDYFTDYYRIGGDTPRIEYEKPVGDDQIQYLAGTLTGAELCDRLYFDSYLKSVADLIAKEPGIAQFDISAQDRIKVTVKSEGVPQPFVKIDLFCEGSQEAAFSALTDNKGEAFLYYNITKGGEQKPLYLEYSSPYGVGSYNLRTGDEIDKKVELEFTGAEMTKKLDLMFMIDTTGSMGDELEYLKTEIRDIISKIVGDEHYTVRTSVNFYRDKGDDYIVHATPFTTDSEEVYEYIRKEFSAGGGDYPEAVHIALDNAVNDHEWDPDAVKLCFFVLDAPPHYEDQSYGGGVYSTFRSAALAAAAKGIRLVPIVSSGSDSLTEYLMRTCAVLTGGTYTFLTDHSGVGNPHSEPDTDFQYEIEKLNEMIIRIAKGYLD